MADGMSLSERLAVAFERWFYGGAASAPTLRDSCVSRLDKLGYEFRGVSYRHSCPRCDKCAREYSRRTGEPAKTGDGVDCFEFRTERIYVCLACGLMTDGGNEPKNWKCLLPTAQ